MLGFFQEEVTGGFGEADRKPNSLSLGDEVFERGIAKEESVDTR